MSSLKNRKVHRWVSIIIAAPFLIILATGILLTTRGFNTWLQPNYVHGSKEMLVTFPEMLQTLRAVPEAKIGSWKDVSQIDIRPDQGQIRVRSKSDHWEVSIDSVTGKVLGSGQRRVSWITAIHEGAFFGSVVRFGIFLPSAVGVLILLLTGIKLFMDPWITRRANRRRKEKEKHGIGTGTV